MREGWINTSLGQACEILSGAGFPRGVQGNSEGDYPFYKVSDMNKYGNEKFMSKSSNYILESTRRKLGAKKLPKGSIIFPKVGGAISTNKKRQITQTSCVDNNIMGLIPKADFITTEFLFYFMESVDIYEFSNKANPPSIRQSVVSAWPISAPPLFEQRLIVTILDEAFAGIENAIANTKQNLANARQLFDGYLNSTFGNLYDNCSTKSLDSICSFSSGGTPSKSNSDYWAGEIPWVSGRDMKSTKLSDSQLHISQLAVDESSVRIAPAGSLLVLVRGMGLAHGAQIAEIVKPCAFNQDIKAIHPDPELVPRYLVFALRHQINCSQNVMSSAAHGTLKIDMDRLKQVLIPFPSREEQLQIVDVIDDLFLETGRLQSIYKQKLTALAELKQSLLQKAFSGELTAGKITADQPLKEEACA